MFLGDLSHFSQEMQSQGAFNSGKKAAGLLELEHLSKQEWKMFVSKL